MKTFADLQTGTHSQQLAYRLLTELDLMNALKHYSPVLCGTIPLGIDIPSSDLDVICDVRQFERFERTVTALYRELPQFRLKRKKIRGVPTVKANFCYQGKAFELFGQPQCVECQYAYLHMKIEHMLLMAHPEWKEKAIEMKKQGVKTEPAFASLLGISGDPYEGLLAYGKKAFGIGC